MSECPIPDAFLRIHQNVLEQGVPQPLEQFRQMVEAGHSLAGAYQKGLSQYESLPYFSSAASRFYSICDAYNYSMVFPPTLTIDFPAGERSFAGALAWHTAHGWQNAQLYGLDYGGWALLSTDDHLVREAQTHGMVICSTLKNGPTALLRMGCDGPQFQAICNMIGRYHAGFLLRGAWSLASDGKIQEKLQHDLQSLDTRQDAWL